MNNAHRPRLLDAFCGAGGCTKGYQRAGFYVVGVDIEPQPHYCGDEFYQGDAIEYIQAHGHEFDVIHASPPCQAYSKTKSLHNNSYPDLVGATRVTLQETGRPYVIENVPGAPMNNFLVLCGTMFGLQVLRHRWFECNPPILFSPQSCQHPPNGPPARGGYHTLAKYDYITVCGHNFKVSDARLAMGIDWMTGTELSQAIPPAYTEWIGKQLLEVLE